MGIVNTIQYTHQYKKKSQMSLLDTKQSQLKILSIDYHYDILGFNFFFFQETSVFMNYFT